MASKPISRSMRFSEATYAMIEQQAGENFSAKFEALVTKCCWELPSKEKELERIQERINYKHTQLRKLDEIITRMNNNIKTTQYAAEQYEYQLRASRKLLQDLCNEEKT